MFALIARIGRLRSKADAHIDSLAGILLYPVQWTRGYLKLTDRPKGQGSGFLRSGQIQGSMGPVRRGSGPPLGPFERPHSRFDRGTIPLCRQKTCYKGDRLRFVRNIATGLQHLFKFVVALAAAGRSKFVRPGRVYIWCTFHVGSCGLGERFSIP